MKKAEFQNWYCQNTAQGHHFYATLDEIEITIWMLAFAFEFFQKNHNIEDKNEFLKQRLSLNGYLAYRAYYRSHGQVGFPIYNCQEEGIGEMIKEKINFRIVLLGETVDIVATPDGQIFLDRTLTDMGITAQTIEALLSQLRHKKGNCKELEQSVAMQQKDALVRRYIETQVSFLLNHRQPFQRENEFADLSDNCFHQKVMKK